MLLKPRQYFYALALGVLATTASAQPTPNAKVADRAPILIENVRPWDAATPDGGTVNVLISDGVIQQVSSNLVDPPGHAINVDGEGRFIVGRLVVGAPANIVVMEDNPSADITLLTDSNALFLVVRNGEIEGGELSDELIAKKAPTYRVVDPTRFRIIRVKKDPWYSYRSKNFSASFVAAALLDRTDFSSKNELESQVGELDTYNSGEIRTVRLGVGGLFKLFDKDFLYTVVGSDKAFDQDYDSREDREFNWIDWKLGTKLYGATLTVGKQKENFTHDLQMLLADQAFMERPMAVTALLSSRNTGVLLRDTAFDERMTWSVGSYFDMFDDRNEPFEDSKEYIARFTGLPYVSANEDKFVHVGFGYRYSHTGSSLLRFSTGPETIFSPAFVDTGEFAATSTSSTNIEFGFKHGPFWLISEFLRTDVNANNFNDPTFDGFHVTGTWAITGEQRGYERHQGLFGKLTPLAGVRTGGIGAWELVARYSDVDLSDGLIEGGDMSRASVGVNWWPSREFKGTIQYGRVNLDRDDISSSSNMIQLRVAMLLGL